MYNHYIPQDSVFSRIPDAEQEQNTETKHAHKEKGFFHFFSQDKTEKNAGLSGILKRFKLDDIDSGDIMLLIILVFVVIQGDNWELAIILGLVLFLSLRDDDDPV